MQRLRRYLQERIFGMVATINQVVREPRSAPGMARQGLVRLWRTHGGGVYGLGYAITFVILEIRLIAGDLLDSEWRSDSVSGVVEGMLGEAIAWLFRFSLESLGSMLQAFLWPILLLTTFGSGALLFLAGVFLAGEWVLRPVVERFLPELRAEAEAPAVDARDSAAEVELDD